MNGFSVIMPTYNQAAYIKRAILSLYNQSFTRWELIIINDGCTDTTEEVIASFLNDKEKITYVRNDQNEGLGKALNQGLALARYDYIAYLPSDDFYFKEHLQSLYDKFGSDERIVLVYSGVHLSYNSSISKSELVESEDIVPEYALQLVQTAHKKTTDTWLERSEWSTDNLFSMYWWKLAGQGIFSPTGQITCNWTTHPFQRHRLLNEKYCGSINKYRQYYTVKHPLKMKVSDTKYVDEEELYAQFRKPQQQNPEGLKILLVGELAYNPERMYALEEYGCKLYGLWMSWPSFSFCTVGPIPFGHIEDIPYENSQEAIRKLNPDIIYGLLNTGSIGLAHEVMVNNPDIPFVWHFKEGPHFAESQGCWKQLIDLYTHADGKIFIHDIVRQWYRQFIPEVGLSFILDGDLPKKECFKDNFSPLLSEQDGCVHTVTTGRIIGLSPDDIGVLAKQDIHFHLYLEGYHESWASFVKPVMRLAPKHFHLHDRVPQDDWVKEFSQYDAGWLHRFQSKNNGDIFRMGWDDLNLPARISTLAAAGLPMIQQDNSGHLVAMQHVANEYDMGVCFKEMNDLADRLKNRERMAVLRENARKSRMQFTFDCHVPRLMQFFKEVINNKKQANK